MERSRRKDCVIKKREGVGAFVFEREIQRMYAEKRVRERRENEKKE
jgi:hypothetical protein